VIVETFTAKSPEFITIFSGEDSSEEQTNSVTEKFEAVSSDAEISVINGKQPVYNYIISAE
jgi:dihydroxyacetone kinase-like predicted kinase